MAARLLSFGLIVSWVKLLKYARAFPTFGPFAVMLGNMVGDIVKFVFLFVGASDECGLIILFGFMPFVALLFSLVLGHLWPYYSLCL